MMCRKHPRYQAKRKPRSLCEDCWRLWFHKNEPKPEPNSCPQGWVPSRRGGCRELGVYDG